MKKFSAIFLFTLFSVYSFSLKTHYCYYADSGKRFHGDCQHEVEEAAAKGELAHANFFPKHYTCFNVVKNALVQEIKIIHISNPSANVFTFPQVIEVPAPEKAIFDWLIPDAQSRSGPPLLCTSPRGSPFC